MEVFAVLKINSVLIGSKSLIQLSFESIILLLETRFIFHVGYTLTYWFLADHTNGRAIATLLRRLSSSSSSVTICIVAKLCVLEQKLLLRAYRKSYMRSRLVPK